MFFLFLLPITLVSSSQLQSQLTCRDLDGAHPDYLRYCSFSTGDESRRQLLNYYDATYRSSVTTLHYSTVTRYIDAFGGYHNLTAANCSNLNFVSSFSVPVLDKSHECTLVRPLSSTCSDPRCTGLSFLEVVLPDTKNVLCARISRTRLVRQLRDVRSTQDGLTSFCDVSSGVRFLAPLTFISTFENKNYSALLSVVEKFEKRHVRIGFSTIGHLSFQNHLLLYYRPEYDTYVSCGDTTGFFGRINFLPQSSFTVPCHLPVGEIRRRNFCPFDQTQPCPSQVYYVVMPNDMFRFRAHSRPTTTTPVPAVIPPAVCPVPDFSNLTVSFRDPITVNVTLPPFDFPSVIRVMLDHNSTVEIFDEIVRFVYYFMTGDREMLGVKRQKRFILSWIESAFSAIMRPFVDALLTIVSPILDVIFSFLLDLEKIFSKILQALISKIDVLVNILFQFVELILEAISRLLVMLDAKYLLVEYVVTLSLLYLFLTRDLIVLSFLFTLLVFLFGLTRPYPSFLPYIVAFRASYLNMHVYHFNIKNILSGNYSFNGTHYLLTTSQQTYDIPSFRLSPEIALAYENVIRFYNDL